MLRLVSKYAKMGSRKPRLQNRGTAGWNHKSKICVQPTNGLERGGQIKFRTNSKKARAAPAAVLHKLHTIETVYHVPGNVTSADCWPCLY